MDEIKLTQFSKAAGCGCKVSPEILREILTDCSAAPFDNLLVGNDVADDAAVLDIGGGRGLISTTDFFMPIVDNPFDFGRVSAANAISDVYAMGGKPVLALAILGWPVEKLPAKLATEVIKGAQEICQQAGIPLAGGHSINSTEPIFGLSVNGLIRKEDLKRNNTVRTGDKLYLTKALGTGILATALKRGELSESDYSSLVMSMTTLNKAGELYGSLPYIHAMTDITGFGLAGHLLEMVSNNLFSAKIYMNQLPVLPGVTNYLKRFIFPDNTTRNYNAVKDFVKGWKDTDFLLLCDPQTSGGLLVAVANESEQEFVKFNLQFGFSAVCMGEISDFEDKPIHLVYD